MKTETLGLLIGGLLPALCFTVTNVSMKLSNQQGIGAAYYVMFVGLGVISLGIALWFLQPEPKFTSKGALYSFGAGIGWAVGAAAVSYALTTYNTPLGKLTPLFNMNTLFTVVIGLWIFAEWQQVRVPQLLIGSVLIVLGGTMVARA